MKYISLKNDFGVDRENNKDVPSDQELSASWLRTGVISGYPILPSDKRRIFIGISNKLSKALKDNKDYVEVTPVEYSFMKEGFERGQTKPELAEYVTVAETALFDAADIAPVSQPSIPSETVDQLTPEPVK